MPTYTSSLGLTLPANGDTGWGSTVNNGVTSLVDSAIAGYASVAITAGNAITLTATNGAANTPRNMMLNITGTLTAAGTVTIPARSKLYFIRNNTTGGFAITVTTGSGTTVSIPNGRSMVLLCDGTNVREAVDFTTTANTTNLVYTGTLTGGTGIVNLGSGQFYKDASGNVGIGTATPAVKLDVIGAGDGGLQYRTSTRTVGIGQTASEASVYWGSTTPLTFFSGSERMRIDSSGNVGIGATPTAGYKLDIYNSANNLVAIRSAGTSSASLELAANGNTVGVGGLNIQQNSANAAYIFNRSAAPMIFGTSGAERMQIDSSGNMLPILQVTPPTLATNQQMVFNLTSNTNLRISVRGTDGTTRTANITLA